LIIIGIDPGTLITGYGIVEFSSNSYKALDYGCIKPPPRLKLTDRYLIIYEGIEHLLATYCPTVLAIETQYVHKNPASALKLGMARGISIIPAKKRGLLVYEYAPTKVKLAVVGNGKASKYQVQKMVQALLNLRSPPEPEDAADALALGICHAHASQNPLLLGDEI
jgi:crossover junction endodeoxyribonuclease RuvC